MNNSDSSVLLRVILSQRNALKEWSSIERGGASALVEVECLRMLDPVRLAEGFDDADVAAWREAVYRLIKAMEIVELTGPVLSRACETLFQARACVGTGSLV